MQEVCVCVTVCLCLEHYEGWMDGVRVCVEWQRGSVRSFRPELSTFTRGLRKISNVRDQSVTAYALFLQFLAPRCRVYCRVCFVTQITAD